MWTVINISGIYGILVSFICSSKSLHRQLSQLLEINILGGDFVCIYGHHAGLLQWKETFSNGPSVAVVYYLDDFVACCNPICMLLYLKEYAVVRFISWSILHLSMVGKILYWHIQSFYWSYISPIYQRYARKSITSTKMLPMWAIQFMKCNLLRQA